MRNKDVEWNCGGLTDVSFAQAQLAVLMDIRDELKSLNGLFQIPLTLGNIANNTRKKRRKRKT